MKMIKLKLMHMDLNDNVQILDYSSKNSQYSGDSCQDISNSGNDETKVMELDESNFFENQEVLEELQDNILNTFVVQKGPQPNYKYIVGRTK
jgi:hypothetical protein